MKRFAGLLVLCLTTMFVYAQEPLNFNPKYKTVSAENATVDKKQDSDIEEQTLMAPSGLKVRMSYGLKTRLDSLNQAPKKEEEIIEKKESK